jgi:hypothetical protein
MHRLTLGYAEKTESSTYVTPMIVDRDKSAARSSGGHRRRKTDSCGTPTRILIPHSFAGWTYPDRGNDYRSLNRWSRIHSPDENSL